MLVVLDPVLHHVLIGKCLNTKNAVTVGCVKPLELIQPLAVGALKSSNSTTVTPLGSHIVQPMVMVPFSFLVVVGSSGPLRVPSSTSPEPSLTVFSRSFGALPIRLMW